MLSIRLFLPFAGTYFLSYYFRTANAVVGPVLSNELPLGAADLGLLTSAYFLAFGLAQLPLGVLLDRFGPRRVESALLIIAAAGAALFACGNDIETLTIARGNDRTGCFCLPDGFTEIVFSVDLARKAGVTDRLDHDFGHARRTGGIGST